jgi:hypothetical protein
MIKNNHLILHSLNVGDGITDISEPISKDQTVSMLMQPDAGSDDATAEAYGSDSHGQVLYVGNKHGNIYAYHTPASGPGENNKNILEMTIVTNPY